MSKIKYVNFMVMIFCLGIFTRVSAEEGWVVKTEIDSLERITRIAEVRNSLGFRFLVFGTKKSVRSALFVPHGYPPVSNKGTYLKVQIDDNPIKRPIFVKDGNLAFLYPGKDLVRQLKHGNKLKICYYGTTGWSSAVVFTLNGSTQAINEALR